MTVLEVNEGLWHTTCWIVKEQDWNSNHRGTGTCLTYKSYSQQRLLDDPMCRLCREKQGNFTHVISWCKLLAQKIIKDDMTKFTLTYTNSCAKIWLKHMQEIVWLWEYWKEKANQRLFRTRTYNWVFKHARSDIFILNTIENECQLIDVTIPTDYNISSKSKADRKDQQLFKVEVARLQKMPKKNVKVIR